MKDDEALHKKATSIKQAKRTMLDVTKLSMPSESAKSRAEVVEWSASMFRARESAEILWKAFLTEDKESFDSTFTRLAPGPREIRLLLDIAHHEPSPDTASRLGTASASRYEPIKAAIRADWRSVQEKGSKKSKSQFVRDWINQQAWGPDSLKMTQKALYECLPKKGSEK